MRSVLVIVDADPRESGRGIEALRMSVGLTLAENRVRVLLAGEGRRLLEPEREAFPGFLVARTYLNALRDQGAEVMEGESILHEARRADSVLRWGT